MPVKSSALHPLYMMPHYDACFPQNQADNAQSLSWQVMTVLVTTCRPPSAFRWTRKECVGDVDNRHMNVVQAET